MAQPLEGIKVLDFGVAYAAPFGAMMLGDMGADVIKIERVEGESIRRGRAAEIGQPALSLQGPSPLNTWSL